MSPPQKRGRRPLFPPGLLPLDGFRGWHCPVSVEEFSDVTVRNCTGVPLLGEYQLGRVAAVRLVAFSRPLLLNSVPTALSFSSTLTIVAGERVGDF